MRKDGASLKSGPSAFRSICPRRWVEDARAMALTHTTTFRVRYADTDQMGSYYHARALEWFEAGRTELSRAMGLSYAEWERRGAFLPLVESHVRYRGRAVYDDLLRMEVKVALEGLSRIQFTHVVVQAGSGQPVCEGWTLHVVCNAEGHPQKLPGWVRALVNPA